MSSNSKFQNQLSSSALNLVVGNQFVWCVMMSKQVPGTVHA